MQSWKTNSRYNFEKRTHKTNFRYKTSIAGDSGHAPFIGDRGENEAIDNQKLANHHGFRRLCAVWSHHARARASTRQYPKTDIVRPRRRATHNRSRHPIGRPHLVVSRNPRAKPRHERELPRRNRRKRKKSSVLMRRFAFCLNRTQRHVMIVRTT